MDMCAFDTFRRPILIRRDISNTSVIGSSDEFRMVRRRYVSRVGRWPRVANEWFVMKVSSRMKNM